MPFDVMFPEPWCTGLAGDNVKNSSPDSLVPAGGQVSGTCLGALAGACEQLRRCFYTQSDQVVLLA
jgi:hypothetical protein